MSQPQFREIADETAPMERDERLIRDLVAEPPSEAAWTRFIREFEPHIRLTALRLVRAELGKASRIETGPLRELVEDMTQEVFVRLVTNERAALARFVGRHELSLRSYLGVIASNVVRDHFKSLRRQKRPSNRVLLQRKETGEPLDLDQVFFSGEPGPEATVLSEELSRYIERGVTSNSKDKVLFNLYFVQGLNMREIAEIADLQMTERAVESALRRIKNALKQRVDAKASAEPNPEKTA